jgi:putative heme iron utilization protein
MAFESTTAVAATARRILRSARQGALGTVDAASGGPFVSLVTVATTVRGAPILLLSSLAAHSRNLAADRRASLLLVAPLPPGAEAAGDPLVAERLTLVGAVVTATTAEAAQPGPDQERAEGAADPADPADPADGRRRFLARHPDAAGYADFADFAFHRFEVARAHLVAGFGRIADVAAEALLADPEAAAAIAGIERGALDHMNADHRDALALYATRLAGAAPGEWRAAGLDPDGIDLACGGRFVRVEFPERAASSADLRRILKAMADSARAGS